MKLKLTQNPLPIIIFTIFLDLVGFGILIPILPLLLANPLSQYFLLPKGMSLSEGYIILGYLIASYPLAQFVATPILGQLSDKYGRKKLLAFSLAGTVISRTLFAIGIISKNLPLLFVSRLFDGITGGNLSVAQASIADITTPENRTKNFGLIGAAFGIGFVVGPYLGGKLSDPNVVSWFNAATPFWFAAILSLLNLILVFFFFPETLQKFQQTLQINWSKSLLNIAHAYTFDGIRAMFATNFLFLAGFTFFTSFFSIFLIQRFHFNQGNIGDFFSYVGIWIAFTQAFITRNIAKVFPEARVLDISILGSGLAILLFFWPSVWWQLLLVAPFFAIFNGLTQANMTALISRSVDPTMQGEILGVNASIQALAQSIPPILSGYIAAQLTPESPIFVAAVTILLAGATFLIFYNKPVYITNEENSVDENTNISERRDL